MIGHAAHDERGKYTGGSAGDQTGNEVYTRSWYNRPWNVVLRCVDRAAAEKIAVAMEKACANDHIGYDQGERTSLYKAAKEVGFDLSKVSVKCECDCSSLVAVCVNAAGIPVSKDIYTGNERKALMNTGKFNELTDTKYLTSDDFLMRGDVLLYEGHHTAVNLTNGTKSSSYRLGWNRDGIGWWYADSATSFYRNTWKKINRCWYYFNDAGYAVKGDQVIDGKQYFFQNIPNDPKECALMKTDEKGALHTFYVD